MKLKRRRILTGLLLVISVLCMASENDPAKKEIEKHLSDIKTLFRKIAIAKTSGRPQHAIEKVIEDAHQEIENIKMSISQYDAALLEFEVTQLLEEEKRNVSLLAARSERTQNDKEKVLLNRRAQDATALQNLIQESLKVYYESLKNECDGLLSKSNLPVVFKSYDFCYAFRNLDKDSETFEPEQGNDDVSFVFNSVLLCYENADYEYSRRENQWVLTDCSLTGECPSKLIENLFGEKILKEVEQIQRKVKGFGFSYYNQGFSVDFIDNTPNVNIRHGIKIPPEKSGSGSITTYYGCVTVNSRIKKEDNGNWNLISESASIKAYPKWEECIRCSKCNGAGEVIKQKTGRTMDFDRAMQGDNSTRPTTITYKESCPSCNHGYNITQGEESNNRNLKRVLSAYGVKTDLLSQYDDME